MWTIFTCIIPPTHTLFKLKTGREKYLYITTFKQFCKCSFNTEARIYVHKLWLVLQISLFHSGFLTNKILYVFFVSCMCYMPYSSHPTWFCHPNNTWISGKRTRDEKKKLNKKYIKAISVNLSKMAAINTSLLQDNSHQKLIPGWDQSSVQSKFHVSEVGFTELILQYFCRSIHCRALRSWRWNIE